MFIEDVYEELRNNNVCKSAYEFSKQYLGRSPSYFSVLKAQKIQPTVDVLLTLEYALNSTANIYDNKRIPYFIRTRNNLLYLQAVVKEHRENRIMEKFMARKNTI